MSVGRIIFISGVVFGCGYYIHRRQRQRMWDRMHSQQNTAESARALEECIKDVWSEPRPLIADVQAEVVGPGDTAAETSAGRMVELPLTPQAQRNAWSIAKYLSREGRTENREESIRTMMQQLVAPGCNWSNGWRPYQDDRRFRDTYEAAGVLLDLAELSLKYAPRGSTEGSGALVCPGWVHQTIAPSQGARPGDYIEVMVDEYSVNPNDDGRNAEWAWVKVQSISDDGGALAGAVTLEAPPGAQSSVLQHSARHGYSPGTSVVVPRSCVFRVIQGK